MKVCKSIPEVLKRAFLVLEKSSILEKPNRWKEFKVIEKEFSGTIIGIGINNDCTSLRLFKIKVDCHYESYDEKKYRPTFKIGVPEGCGKELYWRIEIDNLNANSGNLQSIHKHFKITTEIIQMLTLISHSSPDDPS